LHESALQVEDSRYEIYNVWIPVQSARGVLMSEALLTVAFLVFAVIIGALLKPNADQLRPLEPQPGVGGGDDHHH